MMTAFMLLHTTSRGDHIPTYFYKQLSDLRKAGIRFARGTRSTLLVFGTRSAYAKQSVLRHWGCKIDVYKAEKISSVVPGRGEKAGIGGGE